MIDPNHCREKEPPNSICCDSNVSKGLEFLALIRSLEDQDDEMGFRRMCGHASETLSALTRTCAMQGLLQGDIMKADDVLSSGSRECSAPQDGLKKRRGRRRGYQMSESTAFATIYEGLLISGMIRIFGLNQPAKMEALHLVKSSADFCSAAAEHLKASSRPGFSRISLAEYELMASSAIPLLTGLRKASAHILSAVSNNLDSERLARPEVLLDSNPNGYAKEITTLQSCIRAAATLVSLFATKLSRSSGLVSDFEKLGLTALTLCSRDTQFAASKLLAALPLTGVMRSGRSTPGNSVGENWSDYLMNGVIGLLYVLQTMAPVTQRIESVSDSWQFSSLFGSFLSNVRSCFDERLPREDQRASAFRFLTHGLSLLILSFLARDYHFPGDSARLLDARISIRHLLSLLECMLSFSFASDSIYFATKKRLRLEVTEGGALSPASIVADVASYVKLLGHLLFDAMVSAAGYPPLLPYSNRILRIASGALVTSSSLVVQRSMESSAATAHLGGKVRRWLHTSISLRAKAIQSFSVAISLFGLDPNRESRLCEGSCWMALHNSSGAEICLTVVGGCLLEQLYIDGKDCCDWGTIEERVGLTECALKALESIVATCGGFMPLTLRILVDSIAAAGLDSIVSRDVGPIASSVIVKVAILRLSSLCLSTPWCRGANWILRDKLHESSLKCRTLGSAISLAATCALRLCESLGSPRVPALHVDKQMRDFSGSSKLLSVGSFMTKDLQALNFRGEVPEREQKERAEIIPKEEEHEGQSKRRKGLDFTTLGTLEKQPLGDLESTMGEYPKIAVKQPRAGDKQDAVDSLEGKSPLSSTHNEAVLYKASQNCDSWDEEDFLPEIINGGPDDEDQ